MDKQNLITNYRLSIQRTLYNRYDHLFSFYKVRHINQFLSRNHTSAEYTYLNDIRFYIEDNQFLRRVYYFKTSSGRPQIDNRIQICSDYYAEQLKENQYPKMLLTENKSIIFNRLKRFKKMKAEQGSSDQTQYKKDEQYVDFYEPQSIDFLDDLQRSQEEKIDDISQVISYDSCHQIYDEQKEQISLDEHLVKQIRQVSEQSLNHLIFDLGQPIQTKQEKLMSKSKEMQRSITITPIDMSLTLNNKKQTQKNTISSYLQSLKQKRYINTSQERIIESVEVSCKKQMSTEESLQKIKIEKVQLQVRRRKIRQKAQQLLKKVRQSANQDNKDYF